MCALNVMANHPNVEEKSPSKPHVALEEESGDQQSHQGAKKHLCQVLYLGI